MSMNLPRLRDNNNEEVVEIDKDDIVELEAQNPGARRVYASQADRPKIRYTVGA